MVRFLALLVFIVLIGQSLKAQNRPGDKTTLAKPDTAGRSNASVADEKDGNLAPPSGSGSSALFAFKSSDYESPKLALLARRANADKTEPYLAMQAQMAGFTPDQLEATARRDVKPLKSTITSIDTKSFATKNKSMPQPVMPKELLASIRVKDSLRAIETARLAMELGNTEADAGARKTMPLNSVTAAKADPQEIPAATTAPAKSGAQPPIVAASGTTQQAGNAKNAVPQQPGPPGNKQAGNNAGVNTAGNVAADKKPESEKYVFDKTVFNEMDSKKYPIIIEMPKDSNSANVTGGGDFPKPYTTKKKKVRLFISADENLELPVDQIVVVRYPRLAIQIKLADQNIHNIRDVKLMMTLTNNTNRNQTFLFDRPLKSGFSMWGASCRIMGSGRANILSNEGKPEYEAREFARKDFDHYAFKIKASEWFIKKISVADIVVTDEGTCPGGNLPPDTYTVQLIFQGNYSNVVSFTVY